MPQVDIITGEPRHRTWTIEEKKSILAAAFAPGAVAKEVARRANISTGQLYTWRKNLMKKRPETAKGFARVVTVSDQTAALPPPTVLALEPAPVAAVSTPARIIEPSGVAATACDLPATEIEVRGNKVRIPGSMPPALATAVLRALVQR